MEINTVSIIGLGALGTLFGNHLSTHMPRQNLRIIADRERIARYRQDQVYCNGERCDFHYMTPEEACEPADLLLFAVKFNNLAEAIADVKNHVGERTVILSLINGISSESIIGKTYGMDHILDCVAQGMDAVKVGNRLTYSQMGMLCFGDRTPGAVSENALAVARFFDRTKLPYELDSHMKKRMWGKLMLNVGVNQTVAIYEGNYGTIQQDGSARDTMIAAMKEVMVLSEKEGVNLTDEDLQYWLKVLSTLNPEGNPSMRQDMEAKRTSEVELFAGTILSLGKKHDVPAPTNQMLYDKIKAAESLY